MRLFLCASILCAAAPGATFADDEIARLIDRIELLSTKESPAARTDTLLRAAELLRSANPQKSAEFAARAKRVYALQPLPLVEERRALECALATSDRQAIELAASAFVKAVEHSQENPDDYAWFAALRRKYDIIAGGDNASVRAREALADIAELVNTEYNFELAGLHGGRMRLREQRGKTVLLAFWATWCGPCQEELPLLERLWRDRRVSVLALTDEPADLVAGYMTEHAYTFPVALDPNRSVFDHYRIEAMPAAVVIDETGRLRAQFSKVTEADLVRFTRPR